MDKRSANEKAVGFRVINPLKILIHAGFSYGMRKIDDNREL